MVAAPPLAAAVAAHTVLSGTPQGTCQVRFLLNNIIVCNDDDHICRIIERELRSRFRRNFTVAFRLGKC